MLLELIEYAQAVLITAGVAIALSPYAIGMLALALLTLFLL